MAYQDNIISSAQEIPALVRNFCAARGWSNNGSDAYKPATGTIYWQIGAYTAATNSKLYVGDYGNVTHRADIFHPQRLGSYNAPTVPVPSKLFLFGDSEAVSGVIQYGYNVYRHFHMGVLSRIGNYTGGDVVSSNHFRAAAAPTSAAQGYPTYMFEAKVADVAQRNISGGVLIHHAETSIPLHYYWRGSANQHSVDSPYSYFIDSVIAARELMQDIDVCTSHAPFSSANVCEPIMHYFCEGSTNTLVQLVPVGHPRGVRGINVRDYEPEQVITIGSDDWVVFPEFTKSSNAYTTHDSGLGYYQKTDSSYYYGLAYKK